MMHSFTKSKWYYYISGTVGGYHLFSIYRIGVQSTLLVLFCFRMLSIAVKRVTFSKAMRKLAKSTILYVWVLIP